MALLIISRCVSTVELSFEEAMTPEIIEKYNAKTTGGKYILNPNKG
jgi:hypothetical protein